MTDRPRRLPRPYSLERPPTSRSTIAIRLAIGLVILLIIPIALEVFARILAGSTGVAEELQQVDEPAIVSAYRLSITTPQGNQLTPDIPPAQLAAIHSPMLGYRLVPDRRSDYWSINTSGFRDDDAIRVEKPDGEIRIALLGGSAAFGQLSSGNAATIAEQLEALLNERVERQQEEPDEFQPERLPFFADRVSEVLGLPPRIEDKTYRVINAAVPGYASSNELANYVQHVAAYDPDIVVMLDGYGDAFLPSEQLGTSGVDIDRLTTLSQLSLRQFAWQESKQWFGNLTLVRGFDYYVLSAEAEPQWLSAIGLNQLFSSISTTSLESSDSNPSESANSELDRSNSAIASLTANLPTARNERQQRLDRYRNSLQQMAQFSAGMDSQLLIAVQPEITGRDPELYTPTEQAIVDALGDRYREAVPKMFEQLGKVAEEVADSSNSTVAIDLYSDLNDIEADAFQTPDSLTDEANAVVADRLFEEVSQMVVIFPRPFDPNRDRPQEESTDRENRNRDNRSRER